MVITHGWPGSFLELLKVAPMLADSASDPFHVVVPSLPGYGFSQRPFSPGMNTFHKAELWVALMRELGYDRFVAQGGDIGANVSSVMAWKHPESVLALHLNYIPGSYRPWVEEARQLRPEEIAFKHKAQNPGLPSHNKRCSRGSQRNLPNSYNTFVSADMAVLGNYLEFYYEPLRTIWSSTA